MVDYDAIQRIGLPAEAQAALKLSMRLYMQHARMLIQLEQHQYPHIRFGVVQTTVPHGGRILTDAEMADRAEEVMAPLIALGWRPMLCLGQTGAFRMHRVFVNWMR